MNHKLESFPIETAHLGALLLVNLKGWEVADQCLVAMHLVQSEDQEFPRGHEACIIRH